VKRIAILFALAGFMLFSLGGCSGSKQSLSETIFPDDLEFVVVDSLPEDESALQDDAPADTVCVSATFVDGDSPACAMPVVLYEGDSAVFAALTDDSGRVACGSLPADTVIRFSAIVSGHNTLSLSVRFLSSGQDGPAAYISRDVAIVAPVAQAGGLPCADLLFLLSSEACKDAAPFSAASGASIAPVTDPLHGWSRTTLSLA